VNVVKLQHCVELKDEGANTWSRNPQSQLRSDLENRNRCDRRVTQWKPIPRLGMSRMTPRNQLIFYKSNSVRSRTEECKK
jgi:hypothetical protein